MQDTARRDRVKQMDSGWRIELGRLGESRVLAWLEEKGWKVWERNWRAGRIGEVDIIAEDLQKTLVFLEVKTRLIRQIEVGFSNYGFESVHKRKQVKMIQLAKSYMARRFSQERDCRFDVVVVEFQSDENSLAALDHVIPTIRHVPAAF